MLIVLLWSLAQIKYYAGRVLERMGAGLSSSMYDRVVEARQFGPEYVARMNKTKTSWAKIKVRVLGAHGPTAPSLCVYPRTY